MRQTARRLTIADIVLPLLTLLVACGVPAIDKAWTYQDMVMGFLQTGSEGGWRAANTASFVETAD